MIPRKVSHRQAICLGALMGKRWKNLWCNGLHQAPAQSTKPSANHQAPVQSTKPSAKPSWRRNSHALTSHNVCVAKNELHTRIRPPCKNGSEFSFNEHTCWSKGQQWRNSKLMGRFRENGAFPVGMTYLNSDLKWSITKSCQKEC